MNVEAAGASGKVGPLASDSGVALVDAASWLIDLGPSPCVCPIGSFPLNVSAQVKLLFGLWSLGVIRVVKGVRVREWVISGVGRIRGAVVGEKAFFYRFFFFRVVDAQGLFWLDACVGDVIGVAEVDVRVVWVLNIPLSIIRRDGNTVSKAVQGTVV